MGNEIKNCVCDKYGMEPGDTLYISADWDGGVAFDYIENIQYCPVCGRKLEKWSSPRYKKCNICGSIVSAYVADNFCTCCPDCGAPIEELKEW